MSEAIRSLSADPGVAAVVVAASGADYCAGHDLKEMTDRRGDADGGRAFFADVMQRCSAMMQAITRSPKPFIAAVQGTATAAGCQLVATCDLAVAAEDARFATPGVNIGLFCSTPMVALSRNVPRKRAMEMLLLGETLSAGEAAGYGLVNMGVFGLLLLAETFKSAVTFAAGEGLGNVADHVKAAGSAQRLNDTASELVGAVLEIPDIVEAVVSGVVDPILLATDVATVGTMRSFTGMVREAVGGLGGDLIEGVLQISAADLALIASTLRRTGGNRTRAARALGLQRTYLARLIRDLGLAERPAPARLEPAGVGAGPAAGG